jgi:hypothetical protein
MHTPSVRKIHDSTSEGYRRVTFEVTTTQQPSPKNIQNNAKKEK